MQYEYCDYYGVLLRTVAGYHIRILLWKAIGNCPGQAGRRKTLYRQTVEFVFQFLA